MKRKIILLTLALAVLVWPQSGWGQNPTLTIRGTILDDVGNPLTIPNLEIKVDDQQTTPETAKPCVVTGATYTCAGVPLMVQAIYNSGQIITAHEDYVFAPTVRQFNAGEGLTSGWVISNKNFTASPVYRLTVNYNVQLGAVEKRVNGAITTETRFSPGTVVRVKAIPDIVALFTAWSGDSTSSLAEIDVTMDSDKTLNVGFSRSASVVINSGPGGSVNREPAGLDAGGGTYRYVDGQAVNLTAIPNQGYEFTGWNGDVPANQRSSNPVTITAQSNSTKTITPVFTAVGVLGCPNGVVVIEDGTWVEPAGGPPGQNNGRSAPLNAFHSSQYKRGCLRIGSALLTPADDLTFELEIDGHGAIEGQAEAPQVEVIGGLMAGKITQISDARLKTAITPLPPSVRDLVMKLNPVSFRWKSGGQPSLGLIAQEVAPLFPEVVDTDALDYQTLNYAALVAPLLVEIQAQDRELAELRGRLETLRARRAINNN